MSPQTLTPLDEPTRKKARELFLRARLYRVLALVFAVTGLLIFITLYLKNVQEGGIMAALHRPSTVVMILLPFLPSFLFSRMSQKAEKEFTALMAAHKAKAP